MDLEYVVHSIQKISVPVSANYGSRLVRASLPGLVIELVDLPGGQSHTYTYVPTSDEDMASHEAQFAVGTKIKASFAVVTS